MDLLSHYNNLYHQSYSEISAGNYTLDHQIDSGTDNRFGLTLLIRPGEQINKKLQEFNNSLKEIEPAQYYYPASDIHITVMSVISCYGGFQLDMISVEPYVALIHQSLQGIGPFEIGFKGITASPAAIMAQGFPEGNTLTDLRDNLRTNFKSSNLQQSIDKRYTIATAHATLARFRQPLTNTQQLLCTLDKHRETDFGSFIVKRLDLVYNDWYQQTEKTTVLASFDL